MPFDEKIKHLKDLISRSINNAKPKQSTGFTKEKIYQINIENNYFFNKIKKKGSVFKITNWEKDFRQTRKYIKNICYYPSINFHKTTQRKLELEKNTNQKSYNNTAINFQNNMFSRTRFKNTLIFSPKMTLTRNRSMRDKKSNEKIIFKKEDNNEFDIIFVLEDQKRIKITCKKNEILSDIIERLCKMEESLKKEQIYLDEISVKGRSEPKININDTIEGNKIVENDELYIIMKKD